MLPPLVRKLIDQEAALGEDRVAHGLGMKRRMWAYVKSGTFGLSARSLRSAMRNFPELRQDVMDYLAADPDAGKEQAA